MVKKLNKNLVSIMFLLLLATLMVFAMPSTKTYAALNRLYIEAEEDARTKETIYRVAGGAAYAGDEDEPIPISLQHDRIEINYSDLGELDFPFHFRLQSHGGMYIGKYIVNVDYEKKTVVFTKLGAASDPSTFEVSPPTRSKSRSYFQAGAIFDDNSSNLGFTYPTYKIVANEVMNWDDYVNSTTLGNTYIQGGTVAANAATHPSTFVLCATNVTETEAYIFSQGQVDSRTQIVVKDGLVWKTWTVQGPKKADPLNFGNRRMTSITYEFHGSTSEILDDNENNTVEKLLTKTLIGIGDVFMGAVKNICGKDLNIDNILFNRYQQTIADFFNNNGLYVGAMRSVINGWYEAFMIFARIVMMIVLVGIGVMAILYAGSGKQKKISNMIVGWLMAVILLFFGPYIMKYSIAINNAVVQMIAGQSKYSILSVYNVEIPEDRYWEYQNGEDSQAILLEILMAEREEVTMTLDEVNARKRAAQDEIFRVYVTLDLFSDGPTRLPNGNNVSLIFEEHPRGQMLPSMYPAVTYVKDIARQRQLAAPISYAEYQQKYNSKLMRVETNRMGRLVSTTELVSHDLLTALEEYVDATKEIDDLEKQLEAINKAINIASKNIDLMGTMKNRASATYRIIYAIVWYILIFQLIGFLCLYYKRLLMIAVLIIIFPLVVMFYAIEKLMGIDKPQSFSTWVQEFMANVFVQSAHALLYIMLVETGLAIFEADSDNWLLFVIAVYSLFPLEAVIKNLLGIKGSTLRTVGQGAKALLGAGAVVGVLAKARGQYKNTRNQTKRNADKILDKANKEANARALANVQRDNNIMEAAMRSGNQHGEVAAAQRRIEQLHRQDARVENKAKEDLNKQLKRNTNIGRAKLAAQFVRNFNSRVDAVTSGLAAGGSGSDFVQGATMAGILAGTTRPSVKAPKKENNAPTSAPATNANTGSQTQANTQGTQNNSQPTSAGNRAADQARTEAENAANGANPANAGATPPVDAGNAAPDYGNGRNTQTAREHRASVANEELRNRIREGIQNSRAEVNVNSGATDLHVDDRENDDDE